MSLLDSRPFESFHIDIGIGDSVTEPVEYLLTTDLLSFAGLSPTRVPCYPVTQQIAEKLHAYTKPRRPGENTRVKDFVDMVLLSELGPISSKKLSFAIQATFLTEKTHPIPVKVPPPPAKWNMEFRRMVVDVGLSVQTLDQAFQRIQKFLDPVLVGDPRGEWDPVEQDWIV